MPKIVLIGNTKAAWCTEVHLGRGLEDCGAEVLHVQQEDAHRSGPTDILDLVVAAHADAVCYVRTHNASALGASWTDAWQRLRDAGLVTFSVHLDRFFGLPREELVWNHDPMFTTSVVFTADGGEHPWQKAGVNHSWLPPAVDRTEAEWGGVVKPRYAFDVVFIGSSERTYHPQYQGRRLLLEHLRKTYGPRFAHFGHGGTHPAVRQQDLNDVLASARIVAGDSCFGNEPTSPHSDRYWSDRVPETLGRSTGAILLHPYVPGIRESYSGSELALYAPGDFEDLDSRIGEFLANPGEREGVVERGRARVLRDHTYDNRARTILETLGLPVVDSVQS